ncbi:MAG: 4-alpha-glucanotransferase [Acidobacteriota bacterium]|nr:4-alpha-glucanotransferase [Acidobacteriota bacterium]
MRPPRTAGVLLHPSSLPGPFPCGEAGPDAIRFLDWARAAGQSVWQVLPLGPAGGGDSPYGGSSAFAGNPSLISGEFLLEDGWLSAADLSGAPATSGGACDFSAAARWKEAILREAWRRFRSDPRSARELDAFRAAPQQAFWLADWSLFAAAKRAHRGAGWMAWDSALARRDPQTLAAARRDLAEDSSFEEFVQFAFFRHWARIRREAAARGIEILGDLPIYVAHDSADVWAHRELFALDANGTPERVAGVPPDYFSATGQLWGYPVYRWEASAREGYAWWIERLRANLRLADLVRVDHFRGFAAFWEVEAAEETALRGRWSPGPGRALFDAASRKLGPLPLVAEDLGVITDDVAALLADLGFPGMKVLQFAFSEDDSPHLPHRHAENSVVYTGTHDNDTTRGWAAALSAEERDRYLEYSGTAGSDPAGDLIRLAYESVARRAVIPLQDVLDLGTEARMNTPGVGAGNWTWRARAEDLTPERAERLRRLAELTGRKKLSAVSSQLSAG